jgi:hypothetical protein
MLQVGFGKTIQNLPYFEQSVAYDVIEVMKVIREGDTFPKVRENQSKDVPSLFIGWY